MILGKDGLKLKNDIDRAWPFLITGLIGIPLGTEVLILSSERLLKTVIGAALIIFSVLLLWNVNLRFKRDRFDRCGYATAEPKVAASSGAWISGRKLCIRRS